MSYVNGQDWGFIVSFLAITFLFNKWVDEKNPKVFALLRTRYRVFIVGILYAFLIFLLRGYNTRSQAEALFQAYIYSVVFYSLFVDIPAKWVEDYLKKTIREKLYGGSEGTV